MKPVSCNQEKGGHKKTVVLRSPTGSRLVSISLICISESVHIPRGPGRESQVLLEEGFSNTINMCCIFSP